MNGPTDVNAPNGVLAIAPNVRVIPVRLGSGSVSCARSCAGPPTLTVATMPKNQPLRFVMRIGLPPILEPARVDLALDVIVVSIDAQQRTVASNEIHSHEPARGLANVETLP